MVFALEGVCLREVWYSLVNWNHFNIDWFYFHGMVAFCECCAMPTSSGPLAFDEWYYCYHSGYISCQKNILWYQFLVLWHQIPYSLSKKFAISIMYHSLMPLAVYHKFQFTVKTATSIDAWAGGNHLMKDWGCRASDKNFKKVVTFLLLWVLNKVIIALTHGWSDELWRLCHVSENIWMFHSTAVKQPQHSLGTTALNSILHGNC